MPIQRLPTMPRIICTTGTERSLSAIQRCTSYLSEDPDHLLRIAKPGQRDDFTRWQHVASAVVMSIRRLLPAKR